MSYPRNTIAELLSMEGFIGTDRRGLSKIFYVGEADRRRRLSEEIGRAQGFLDSAWPASRKPESSLRGRLRRRERLLLTAAAAASSASSQKRAPWSK